jgi:uncharacterized protein (DUF302 family)
MIVAICSIFLHADNIIKFEIDKDIDFLKLLDTFELNNCQIESTPRLEKAFGSMYNNKKFDTYRTITFIEKDLTPRILQVHPSMALFTPFPIAISSKRDSNKYNILFLGVNGIKKIINIDDNDKLLEEFENKNIKMIKEVFPNAKRVKFDSKDIKQKSNMYYKRVIKAKSSDKVISTIESKISDIGYKVINYLYLKDFSNQLDKKYKEFVVLSLCKKSILNKVSKVAPDAIVFAPCSLMISQRDDTDEIEIAYPTLSSWIELLSIEDKKLQKEMLLQQSRLDRVLNSI